jgi:hypothetical protein
MKKGPTEHEQSFSKRHPGSQPTAPPRATHLSIKGVLVLGNGAEKRALVPHATWNTTAPELWSMERSFGCYVSHFCITWSLYQGMIWLGFSFYLFLGLMFLGQDPRSLKRWRFGGRAIFLDHRGGLHGAVSISGSILGRGLAWRLLRYTTLALFIPTSEMQIFITAIASLSRLFAVVTLMP